MMKTSQGRKEEFLKREVKMENGKKLTSETKVNLS
jgi:hypothetical protein